MMLALLLPLLFVVGARGACITSTDDFCIELGRDECDQAGELDVCGPCSYGMQEGSEISPVNSQAKCIPITCQVTEDAASRPTFSEDLGRKVGIASIVSFTCKDGYWSSGTQLKIIQRVCTDTGEFYSEEDCEPLNCDVPDDVSNAKPESLAPVPLGSSVEYICELGYTAAGKASISRTCLPSGKLSPTVNCTDFDACVDHPCGESADCVDLPAPSLNFTCTCKPGFVGTAERDDSGCYRLGLKSLDDRIVLTAADLTLYNPESDRRLALTGILSDLNEAKTALEAFRPQQNDGPMSNLLDALSSRITGTIALTASKASTARSAELSLQSAQSSQVSRAVAAQQILQNSVSTQRSEIQDHRASVVNDISRALTAEASLSTSLAARINALVSSLSTEASRAKSVESAQELAVTALSNTATSIRADLTSEVSRAISVEAAVDVGVLSLTVTLSALRSTVTVLSNLHSTTLSMATSTSAATVSAASRATVSQQSLTASINTLRTDLTSTQTTLTSVSGTLSMRVPTLTSISATISSVALQVASLATAMSSLQMSTSVATSMFASQSAQINTANNNLNTQSTLITTVSNTAGSTSTTQAALSTTTSSLTTSINVVNNGLGTLNTRVNTMSATSCSAASGNLLFRFGTNGAPTCAALSYTYIRNWFNSKCWMGVGWRDSCNGCGLTPSKFVYMYASGSCKQSVGTNNACGIPAGWSGINTDGTVGDDDNFYVRVGCDV